MTFSRGPLRVFVMFITIAVCVKNFSIKAFSTPVSKVNGICNSVHVCANMNTKKIGSSLFMAGYVPDGLTREEYEQIKAKERTEVKKKNFAMFGPRFKPTGAPEGDWMVNSSLWTGGFNSNSKGGNTLNAQNPDIIRVPKFTIRQVIGKYVPILSMIAIVVESMIWIPIIFRKTFPNGIITAYLSTWTRSMNKLNIARIVVPLLLSHRIEKMVTQYRIDSKRLWSRRRSTGYFTLLLVLMNGFIFAGRGLATMI